MNHQVDVPPFTLFPAGYTPETWRQALGASCFTLQIQHHFDDTSVAGLWFMKGVPPTNMPTAYGRHWPYWLRQLAAKLSEDEPFRANDYWRAWAKVKVDLLERVKENSYLVPEHIQVCNFFTAWYQIIPTETAPTPKLIR